jgi:hypothetical protein
VLIFDAEREVFVLHRVDSMFNMNLVRTPTNDDAESLREDYPQLEAYRPSKSSMTANKAVPHNPTKSKKTAAKESKLSAAPKADPPRPPPATKPKKTHNDSEDESSDDDLLTIEDPGGAPPPTNRDFSPGFIDKPRRFSEFVQQQNEEEDEDDDEVEVGMIEAMNDADGEEEEEEEEDDDDDASEHFKLPSPITRQMMGQSIHGGGSGNFGASTHNVPVDDEEVSDEDEEMEDVEGGGATITQDNMAVDDIDLEAELMAELEKEDSDVSEEE